MAGREPTAQLVEQFSEPGVEPMPWAEVVGVLESAEMFFLSTTRRDGRPHVAPLPAMWLDGRLHFCTGAAEQKARNLAADPRCVLTTGTDRYRSGLDVVVEGRAVRVADHDTLVRLAALWQSTLDWAYEVVDGAFRHADGAEGEALAFALDPDKVLAFGKAPYRQTRYRFG